jgi:transcriptional regulator with XRE-family HTH domain
MERKGNMTFLTFGDFLAATRRVREIPSLQMAEKLGLSPGYYCDIEKNRGKPPERSILQKMIDILNLSQDETNMFYDLAGKARSEAPPDLPGYINENQFVRVALRLAKDRGNADDWRRFIQNLESRQSDEGG